MPAVPFHPNETLPLQVEKYGCAGDKGGGDGNPEGPAAISGVVVAALTLLVAIISLRSSRFRHWASHLLPPQLVKKVHPLFRALHRHILHLNSGSYGFAQKAPVIAPPNLAPTTITNVEGLCAIPVLGIPIPGAIFIFNLHFGAHPPCRHANTLPCGHTGVTGGGGRVPQAEKPPGTSPYEVSSKMGTLSD
ncbi:hypothetical protein HOY80DRAFT_1136710 [Tuber brumale]|nr:hypothetical protein HOY80DRAFT_1136710 [Tuber brumale]